MYEAEIVSEGVSAATTGNVGLFAGLIDGIDRTIQSAVIAASTAGQLHVELEKLTQFYNALATLHDEELSPRLAQTMHTSAKARGENAGGHVPGVQAAWRALVESVGGTGSSRSLYANLKAVDDLVLKHMASMLATAQRYAAQENQAIAGFGKVTSAAASSPTASSPSPSGSKSTNGGW